ncbi:ribosome-assembly protein 3-domain-containing protein [Xylariaceae sp. FL0594]|nr:ribosome-assembly protein 3-domain-containing protein [Xylariaceae sp. FL0594]
MAPGVKGQTQKPATGAQVEDEFRAYYLQQSTKEFAEDLDKVRSADDFKGDSALRILVESLRQGTSMFSASDQKRVVDARRAAGKGSADEDDSPPSSSSSASS